ncbi:MAG: error-prone DNA polymerase [Chloroflexota bacterium]|nr:error-prone DNA polymerase [Chloroflexota bacterium]
MTTALVRGDRRGATRRAEQLRECFGRDRIALLLTHHRHPGDSWLAAETALLARRTGLPLAAAGLPVHASHDDKPLLDVLTAIRHRTTLDGAAAHGLLLPNAEHRMRSEMELRALLGGHLEAFDLAAHLAEQCAVDLDFSEARFPGYPVPEGETPFSVLYRLCQESVQRKYRPMTRAVASRLQRELEVIEKTNLAEFFLITWDIMRFARERNIPGQGRGSAADSIVAYLLDITRVDPVAHDLLFERFLHEDHQGTPDIDIDFSTDHREQVLQYVYDKYGADRTGMVANIVTYRPRMAMRQVGAAMGFPETVIGRLATSVDGWYMVDVGSALESAGVDAHDPNAALPWRQLFEVLEQIDGTPRHLGIHVSGMLVTGEPLVDVAPVERATMPGRVVVQFNKDDVEDLGLIKMDLLGLRTLSLIKDAVAMIDELHGVRLDLGTIALDDPAVYDLICEVDTIGLFQVESRAQAQALPRVRPRNFADIVVEVAIIRPGPLQGNMVNPYINRRQGREPVAYAHPLLEPILKETLGVILFQEQILRVSMAVAGFTAAEADKLRRAMSRARSSEDMEALREPFVRGALAHGVDDATSNLIFGQIAAFAEFGFCKSHAAAFALTAYHTAHLKLYYPAEFYVGLFNNQPMGFYSPAVIAGDAKRHGIRMLPVDVNRSQAKVVVELRASGAGVPSSLGRSHASVTTAHPYGPTLRSEVTPAPNDRTPNSSDEIVADRSVTIAQHRACRVHDVRLGFGEVKGLGAAEAGAIVRERERGDFVSFDDFAQRVGLKEEALRNLALVGAFDSLGEARRALLWRARDAHKGSPGFSRPVLAYPTSQAPVLPALSEQERTALDYRITGIPTGPQVMQFYRERLAGRGVLSSADVQRRAHGTTVTVAGAMVVKQHPETAKGHVFLSLEDEFGLVNIIIRPATYAKYKPVVDLGGAVVVEGTLQHVDGVVSVLARRLDELALFVKLASRDWQ